MFPFFFLRSCPITKYVLPLDSNLTATTSATSGAVSAILMVHQRLSQNISEVRTAMLQLSE